MIKTYKLQNLDCANCANKLEKMILAIDGVIAANISFMTQKLTLEINDEDFIAVFAIVQKKIRKVDRSIVISQ